MGESYFIGKIRKGDDKGLLEITIPSRFAKYEGLIDGDDVKVIIKKKVD